ncbi:CRISPR-associated protein Cse3 [Skermanella aerolata]|uniref:CRISPR-associated protein Cse3 n=1 Tax=Skermanella aerolata TaxID=393310 RepID=A0A512E0U0_9PROT|nr:type I-E CRISPR-associated protein Cas6/Cse3/CasE [Skermanella aerolata]KJB91504.1 CRISPR-associated protein Cse3 [Skermanella aerolata KACC 11604]GEO42305.1 CRISPR-associated protein Cse3 [Skermanella aerolata]
MTVAPDASLFMLHFPIDTRRLVAFAEAQGIGGARRFDEGYAVHALLRALFGPSAPVPFTVRAARDLPGPAVLAYGPEPLAGLAHTAGLTAEPLAHAVVDWARAADKPMPAAFPAGMRVGFEVRACPVVRVGRSTVAKRPGAEVDAFLSALDAYDRSGEGAERPVRESVYLDWLRRHLEGGGAAGLLDGRVDARRLRTVLRKTQPTEDKPDRASRNFARPDVVFSGTLRVEDSIAFRTLLARGIGRHRSFGFGMLLLRPAGND